MRYILLAYAFGAIFTAGGIFFKNTRIANIALALFILLLGIEVLEFLLSTSKVIFEYPEFRGLFFFPIGYLYGPLLLIHLLAMCGIKISKLHLLHFIPFVIILIVMSELWFMDGSERISFLSENFMNWTMNMNYARVTHLFIYGIILVYFVYHQRFFLKPKEKLYELSICLIYFLSTVLISLLTEYASGWRDFIYYYFTSYTLIFLIAYLLYSDPKFLSDISKKYLRSGLKKNDMKRILVKIQDAFKMEQTCLDRELSLPTFSEQIGEKPHHISQTLSVKLNKNFNEYVNTHRVQQATKILLNPLFDHYKIEAVALEAGFNNKVTFNKAFLKETGVTPSEFKRSR